MERKGKLKKKGFETISLKKSKCKKLSFFNFLIDCVDPSEFILNQPTKAIMPDRILSERDLLLIQKAKHFSKSIFTGAEQFFIHIE